ncbi:alpha/beta hydrolase [Gimesia aquarii]|uniref:Carboxylesterase NlhH n=1 Tax=Gimesia aquarii TaxID=2527964 RepID=A0A517X208_9PLAN|nr:alpha/beta hydrolase fold domain-containing protein [Gimesia aquarii]QDU11543.1 Carboxylesterase NlhH [Gimesia aquarii]
MNSKLQHAIFSVSLFFVTCLVGLSSTPSLNAADKKPPKSKPGWKPLKGADYKVYKTTEQGDLHLNIFKPKDWKQGDSRPVIVFFFGGGWTGGNPSQFEPHCQYLAARGMVACAAEYRIKSKHKTTPFECVADGKSAVRWIRQHAKDLGIDPNRIVSGGGSAGGHVAACTGTVVGFEEPEENQQISSVPNAMALFNPVVDTTETGWKGGPKQLGKRCKEISPIHFVRNNLPPTIIFHGTADKAVPIENVERFTKQMKAKQNRCELAAYKDQGHGFFNLSRSKENYNSTVEKLDTFLMSLGYLSTKK